MKDEIDKLKMLTKAMRAEIGLEISKLDSQGRARTLHLQAAAQRDTNAVGCVRDCASAIAAYADGEDENNLQAVVYILKDCLPLISKSSLDLFDDIGNEMDRALAALVRLNSTGRYARDIAEIKRDWQLAKSRSE